MFGGPFALNKWFPVLLSHYIDKTLHFLSSCIHDFIRYHLPLVLIPIICEIFRENHNLRHLINWEFFAQLFLLEAVDSGNFNYTIDALRHIDILVFEVFAFFKLGVEEVDDPDLLSTIELEHLAKVELNHIRGLEQKWNNFWLLLLLVEVLLMTTASLLEV